MRELAVLLIWLFLLVCLLALLFPAAFDVFLNQFFGIVGRFLAYVFIGAFLLWAIRRLLFGR